MALRWERDFASWAWIERGKALHWAGKWGNLPYGARKSGILSQSFL